MWLINTSTIKLERVDGEDLEWTPYAILSHTWGEDEVTFEEMILSGQPKHKLGYAKIETTCRLVKERGIAYSWVDTCCIDKRSSAELAEAMFRWYRCATVCFTHLENLQPFSSRGIDKLDSLEFCRWFTRGWTLQELIGSQNLEFYDSTWEYRGTKSELRDRISDITSIDIAVLEDNTFLESIPVVKRMSWAANRKTTRIEDLAYCLLGIFDVNMRMMYGEGKKAFKRLQEAIIKETTDMSIFAWKANDTTQDYRGILAQFPAEFAHCRRLSRAPSRRHGCETTMTNKGLRLETFLGKGNILNLSCLLSNDDDEEQWIGVFLTKTAHGYVRSLPTKLFKAQDSKVWTGTAPYKFFIRRRVTPFVSLELKRVFAKNLAIRCEYSSGSKGFEIQSFATKPADLWDQHGQSFITSNSEHFTGFLDFKISCLRGDTSAADQFIVVCGLTAELSDDLRPWMAIYDARDSGVSEMVMRYINAYYDSDEELYLHHLRDRLLLGNSNLPHEIKVPKSGARFRLFLSSNTPRDIANSLSSITIHFVNRSSFRF